MTPATFMKRYNLQAPIPVPEPKQRPEAQPYAKLTRAQVLRRIEKHYKLSPMQRNWTTVALRFVLEMYEPA